MFTKDFYSKKKNKENVFGFASDVSSFLSCYDKDECSIVAFPPGTYSKYELSFKTFSEWALVFQNKYFYTHPSVLTTTLKYDMENVDWYIQGIQNHFQEAIRKRCHYVLDSGSDVGCLLSGGFKSNLVAGILSKELKSMYPCLVLHTFTIGCKNSVHMKKARETATFLGTQHHEIILEEECVFDQIREVVMILETTNKKMIRDGIGSFLIGKWIKENTDNIDFLFTGDGADVLCGSVNMNTEIDIEMETRDTLETARYSELYRSSQCLLHHGIKTVMPFMDMFFVNFCFSIPLHIRCQEKEKEKDYLIRKAFTSDYVKDEILPERILYHETKFETDKDWFLEIIENSRKVPNTNEDVEGSLYSYYFDSLFPQLTGHKDQDYETLSYEY
jgi:asparagine synthase (glutamine-hydrolysing)